MPDPLRDPGLQPERTALAWRRTALALFGMTLYVARTAWTRGLPGMAWLSLLAAAAAMGFFISSAKRGQRVLNDGGESAAPTCLFLASVAATLALLGPVMLAVLATAEVH